jgi:hypothetical protein
MYQRMIASESHFNDGEGVVICSVLRPRFNNDEIEALLHKAFEVLAIVIWVTFLNAFAPGSGVPFRILVPRSIGNVEFRQSRTSNLRLHTLIGAALMLGVLAGCNFARPPAPENQPPLPKPPLLDDESNANPRTDLSAIVQTIPENAPKWQMDDLLDRFMPEFFRVRSGDMQQVIAAVAILRDQPSIVASLVDYYYAFRAPEYEKRMMTIGLIGELQRTDAMPFFDRIIWNSLWLRQPIAEGPVPRELKEMIRVKAVHGLAYLRTDEADQAIIDVMQYHDSIAIRITAIDSYMWNKRDSEEAAQQLYIALPTDLHKFVQRPRFRRGMDRAAFNAQLETWRKTWALPRSGQ